MQYYYKFSSDSKSEISSKNCQYLMKLKRTKQYATFGPLCICHKRAKLECGGDIGPDYVSRFGG